MKKENKRNKRMYIQKKQGFTLIEMIVTVAILAVLTSVISVGVYGYMLGSYMNRVNETARTVFLASQNYLLEQKQLGKLESFNQQAKNHGGMMAWDDLKNILSVNNETFDVADYEENYTTDTTAYLSFGPGSNKENNPLYTIVQMYTQDTSLLDHTFWMEYDTETGVVRSVFYSEKTDYFTYQDDNDKSKANVIVRNVDALKEKRQGYYGVDTTGRIYSKLYVESPKDVLLFNGERLFLQWTDDNKENPEFLIDSDLFEFLRYDVNVYRLVGNSQKEILFSLSDIEVENIGFDVSLDAADDINNAPYRVGYDKDTKTYQLILDDMHHDIYDMYGSKDKENGNSALTVFEEVQSGDYLVCDVTAKLDPDSGHKRAVSLTSNYSNEQNANYGGGSDEAMLSDGTLILVGGSGKRENGTLLGERYSIFTARHFNHIRDGRNTPVDAHYVQTANIDYGVLEVGRVNNLAFVPFTFSDGLPFNGSYTAQKNDKGKYYSVDHITIKQNTSQNVGLFAQNKGKIEGLTLLNPQIEGSYHVGTVAGVNGGILKNITVKNGTVKGSHILGGVVGRNTAAGEMNSIQSDCKIEGTVVLQQDAVLARAMSISLKKDTKGTYIGGIAGVNEGKASNLETDKNKLTGTAYLGGVFGANLAEMEVKSLKNNQTIQIDKTVATTDESKHIGGVVGYQGANTELVEANNYGQIEFLDTTATKLDRVENVGGIVGTNLGFVSACRNEQGKTSIEKTRKDYIELIKQNKTPKYQGKNVGGLIGYNQANGRVVGSWNDGVVLGYSVVGGVIGKNEGAVMNIKGVDGLVIGANNMVGGIFGYHAGSKIENFSNDADVYGNGIVGGIIGMNSVLGVGGEEKILAEIANFGQEDTPDYYSKLLEVRDGSLGIGTGAVIDSCTSTGFVYARQYYSGGIAGINYGTLKACEVLQDATIQALNADGRADCVGGIVGYNVGNVVGKSSTYNTVVSIAGDDFVGGIAGVNIGQISGYNVITGKVIAKGDCVGGVMGINTNPASVGKLSTNDSMIIEGDYFVGGIMGCNVSGYDSNKITEINNVRITGTGGKVKGEAYIGGVIGYNAYTNERLQELYGVSGELTLTKANTYKDLENTGSATPNMPRMVFDRCVNSSKVEGNRYVGGIVGYNSTKAELWITGNYNYGTISIVDKTKVQASKDGNYYYYIGGITGRNSVNGVIDKSVNDGSVLSPSTFLGGICEVNEGYIQYSAIGNTPTNVAPEIKGENSVGGIVGVNRATGKVISCKMNEYGIVRGGNRTGGLVGVNLEGGIINSNLTGKEAKAMSIIGRPENSTSSSVSLSLVDGRIWGGDDTGGVAGINTGTLTNVEVGNKARILGGTRVGGFIGYNQKGSGSSTANTELRDLSNKGFVQGKHEVGGIVGKHSTTAIVECTNVGYVWATDRKLGYAGGITGSIDENIEISSCVNYGTVKSNYSSGGGIVGYNKGILRKNYNYGNVEADELEVTSDSLIGGITGYNAASGIVENCGSKSRKEDPNGKKNNPYYDEKVSNKIRGNYTVGGLIGMQAQSTATSKGDVTSTDVDAQNISIDIEPYPIETEIKQRTCIGGVVGAYSGNSSIEDSLSNFTFSGVIRVSANSGAQRQHIGGITGTLPAYITLENCMFTGRIEGSANDKPTTEKDIGVGGLAGYGSGTIIVYPTQEGGNTIYTSNTTKSSVTGATKVGGVVGMATKTLQIKLKDKQGNVQTLSEINKDGTNGLILYENRASVSAVRSVGGIFGVAQGESLEYLKNTGEIKSLKPVRRTVYENYSDKIGGIVGYYQKIDNTIITQVINHCYNEGAIVRPVMNDIGYGFKLGGIVGDWSDTSQKKVMRNSQNTAVITGGYKEVGGLVGRMINGTIEETCKNTGNITIRGNDVTPTESIGGIAGWISGVTIGGQNKPLTVMNLGTIVLDSAVNRDKAVGGAGGIVGMTNGLSTLYNVGNEGSIYEGDENRNKNRKMSSGGLVGVAVGKINIEGCENAGMVSANAGEACGGIVGRIYGPVEGSISNTTNIAEVKGRKDIGGLIGELDTASTLTFQKNLNQGKISGLQSVGGLVGGILKSSQKEKMITLDLGVINEETINEGEVSLYIHETMVLGDNGSIGGCIGFVETKAQIKGLVNKGPITISNTNYISNLNISEIGGVIGSVNKAESDVSSATNKAEITINLTGKSTVRGVGGIIGGVKSGVIVGGQDNADMRSFNQGNITVTCDSNGKINAVGGVVGYQDTSSKIKYATNQGNVKADRNNSREIGGIAGNSSGMLLSCKTEKNVEIEGGTDIGGLIGSALSYNCRVTSIGTGIKGRAGFDLSYSEASVYGKGNLGGLIGSFYGATIYNVYVGENASVTLETCATNAEDITANAGGLIGYAGTRRVYNSNNALVEDDVQGIIANSYSLATVQFKEANPSNLYYIGAIVGYRDLMKENSKKGRASLSIQDCYGIKSNTGATSVKVSETQPPMPKDHGLTIQEENLIVKKSVYGIGNEPLVTDKSGSGETYMFFDKGDYQVAAGGIANPLEYGLKHLWSKEIYEVTCDQLGITPTTSHEGVEALQAIMQAYKGFKLPNPDLGSITDDFHNAFQYNFPLHFMAGFYKNIKIEIYQGRYDTWDQINDNQLTPFETMDVPIEFGDEISSRTLKWNSLPNIKQLVGEEFSVVVYAEGFQMENGEDGTLNYTTDSDKRVAQNFVIMPPMLTPEIERLPAEESDYDSKTGELMKVRFELKNYAEYKKSVIEDYPQLKDRKPILNDVLYEQYQRGLRFMTIKDHYNTTVGATQVGAYEEWYLYFPEKPPTDLTNKKNLILEETPAGAFFTIDYKNSVQYPSIGTTRQHHSWSVLTVVEGKSITLNTKGNGFRYRYSPADPMLPVMRYKLTGRLPAPKSIKNVYSGNVDINTANTLQYKLEWNAPVLVEGMNGYELEFTKIVYNDAQGVKQEVPITPAIVKRVASNETGTMTLTKGEIDTIMSSLNLPVGINYWDENQPEYRIVWTAQTQSLDPKEYIPSVKVSNEIVLLKQQRKVTDMTAKKNVATNSLDLSWVDAETANAYEVSYTIRDTGGVVKKTDSTTKGAGEKEWTNIGLDSAWSNLPFFIEVKVKTLGVLGKSLDSEIAIKDVFTGEQLKTPKITGHSVVKVENDLVDATKEYITFKVDFDKDSTGSGDIDITTASCNGYRLIAKIDETRYETQVEVTGADTITCEIPVLLTGHPGKPLIFYLEAMGNGITTADSEKTSLTTSISNIRAEKPRLAKVQSNLIDIYTNDGIVPPISSSLSFIRGDYMSKLNIVLGIDSAQTVSAAAIKGQSLQLQIAGTEIHKGVTTIMTTGSYSVANSVFLLANAGMDVLVKMNNLTNDVQAMLPSEVSEFTFTLPKIKLSNPEIVSIVETPEVVEDLTAIPPVDGVEAYYTASYKPTSTTLTALEDTEEKTARKEQIIVFWDTVNDKQIEFYEVGDDGVNKTPKPSDSLVVLESNYHNTTNLREVKFRIAVPDAGPNVGVAYDLTKVEMRIQNMTNSGEKKYDNSLETKQAVVEVVVTP